MVPRQVWCQYHRAAAFLAPGWLLWADLGSAPVVWLVYDCAAAAW